MATYGELKRDFNKGVQRHDLNDDVDRIFNDAQRRIQDLKSFTFMKKEISLTMASGALKVSLPTDYKNLQEGISPIGIISIDGIPARVLPCDIKSQSDLERLHAYVGYGYFNNVFSPLNHSKLPVFLDSQQGIWTINIIQAADRDLTFNVRYYAYIRDLLNDEDENWITQRFSQMLLNKAKAIAFELINDEQAGDCEQLFQAYYKMAEAQDNQRLTSGRNLRM